jgi:DNA-binding CsgD family transcriptional regulator
MQNGIAQIYINSPMRFVNEDINLQGSGYETIESDNGTYYSTSNGIYYLEKNATQCIFINGTEGPAYGMNKIAGKLYSGHHTGLFLLENGTARRIAVTDGMWRVKQLQTNNEYCIGGTYSGLYLFKFNKNAILEPIKKVDGFDESSRFIEEDAQGNIWVGQYYKGLYKLIFSDSFQEVEVQKITGTDDLSIDNQIILGKVDNELYIATNKGMYKLDPSNDQFTKAEIFTEIIGDQPVYLFGQDNERNVHFIAENKVGFYKQISPNNYVFVPSSLYQLRYHLNNDLLNVSVNSQYGVMYSANKGFIHYDPQLESQVPVTLPLSISKVYSITQDSLLYYRKPFEEIPESLEKLTIDHRAKVIKIEVESFQFNNMDNHQFRYFLKGFDEDYGEWTNFQTKEYTNLQEGEYVFLAQTKNHLGEITTSYPLELKVNPPFHRSLTAKIIYILLALLSLILVAMVQRRRYKSRAIKIDADNKRKLEEEQLKLLKAQEQKKKELQFLHDEKIQSELQHVNNLLAASTMNLVVKNEFIDMIKEQLNDLKKMGETADTKKVLELIIKEIDTTLRLKEDWEDFEYHFDKVHGDFLSRLREKYKDLTPNEQKLCAFLRLNLSTKEIANSMSISLRGVEVARYRLRKKLNLQKGQNLTKFILEF